MKATRLATFFLLLAVLPAAVPAAQAPVMAVPVGEQQRTDLVTLLVPEAVDVEQVDGMVWPGQKNVFRRGDQQVRMTPGVHEVAIQFNQLYDTAGNNHEVVKSKVLVLRFAAEPGQTYRVAYPPVKNLTQAQALAKNFSPRIEDAAGNNRIVAATQQTSNWRGEGFTSARDDLVNAALAASVAAVAAAPAVAAAAGSVPAVAASAAAAAVPAAPAAAPAVSTPLPGAPSALDMLKFSWQGASEADRAAFRAWIGNP